MTCILGLEHAGDAWIGSDSYVGNDSWRDRQDRPKFFRRGRLVLAFCGGVRAGSLVETIPKFRARKRGETDLLYLNRAVIEPIRQLHITHNAVEADWDFAGLIAYDGRIYAVLSDYGLLRSNYGYAAIGTGEAYALGALAATKDMADPEARVRLALAASAKHCNHVAQPFHTVKVSGRQAKRRETVL